MRTIAALLTVYNRKEKTLACLRELFAQNIPDNYILNVYLTDDGCTDGTPEAIAIEFPSVHIIKGDGSLFWNRGMYAAWSAAEKKDYDFFLWLNDDTFLFEDCIIKLLEESNNYDDKSIIIGATLDSDKQKITYSGWNGHHMLRDLTGERKVDHFNGNIVLIPREVYEKIGKNDPYYRHALGDFDYGLRATKAGINSIVYRQALGICDEHETIPKWKNSNLPLIQRWKALYSVGGNGANPNEFFYYQHRHRGIATACLTYLSNHLHVLFPKFWK